MAADIVQLCRISFDITSREDAEQQAALKQLANTLLLEEESRQFFADSGYAEKVADRLAVSKGMLLVTRDIEKFKPSML